MMAADTEILLISRESLHFKVILLCRLANKFQDRQVTLVLF